VECGRWTGEQDKYVEISERNGTRADERGRLVNDERMVIKQVTKRRWTQP
jgi:hypothetical protein